MTDFDYRKKEAVRKLVERWKFIVKGYEESKNEGINRYFVKYECELCNLFKSTEFRCAKCVVFVKFGFTCFDTSGPYLTGDMSKEWAENIYTYAKKLQEDTQ